jgi:FixJ family two-component response regulator
MFKGVISPDLILCDVKLQNISCFKLKKILEDRLLKVPIIFVTGLCGEDGVEGGYHIIRKPINTINLEAMIKKLLQ